MPPPPGVVASYEPPGVPYEPPGVVVPYEPPRVVASYEPPAAGLADEYEYLPTPLIELDSYRRSDDALRNRDAASPTIRPIPATIQGRRRANCSASRSNSSPLTRSRYPPRRST